MSYVDLEKLQAMAPAAQAADAKLAPTVGKMKIIMSQHEQGLLTNGDLIDCMFLILHSSEV